MLGKGFGLNCQTERLFNYVLFLTPQKDQLSIQCEKETSCVDPSDFISDIQLHNFLTKDVTDSLNSGSPLSFVKNSVSATITVNGLEMESITISNLIILQKEYSEISTESNSSRSIEENSESRVKQRECVKERKEESKKSTYVERKGDWTCLKCKNLNFRFRLFCNRCKIPIEQCRASEDVHIKNIENHAKISQIKTSLKEMKKDDNATQLKQKCSLPEISNFPLMKGSILMKQKMPFSNYS